MQKTIPIVMATDEAFLLNCYVTVYSVIKAAASDRLYEIFIFVSDLSEADCKKLESLSTENKRVKCVDITHITSQIDLRRVGPFSIQTYYRLFIPLLLPGYEKVLYLDADMCVLRDVSELYDVDLEGHICGVVRDVPCPHLERHDYKIGRMDCRNTFNAGLLLVDVNAFEKEHVRDKCLILLHRDYERGERQLIYPDNDALNLVLYNRCKWLPDSWNFQWQYLWRPEEIYEDFRERYQTASRNPDIIHYAGGKKPWTDPDLPMAEIFWSMAVETPVWNEIIIRTMKEAKSWREGIQSYHTFTFPYGQIPYQSRIAIYGAGKVGQAFYRQMCISEYVQIALWVDKSYEKLREKYPVEPPAALADRQDQYDYILISIEDERVSEEVTEQLLKMGIGKEKIVWAQYKRRR